VVHCEVWGETTPSIFVMKASISKNDAASAVVKDAYVVTLRRYRDAETHLQKSLGRRPTLQQVHDYLLSVGMSASTQSAVGSHYRKVVQYLNEDHWDRLDFENRYFTKDERTTHQRIYNALKAISSFLAPGARSDQGLPDKMVARAFDKFMKYSYPVLSQQDAQKFIDRARSPLTPVPTIPDYSGTTDCEKSALVFAKAEALWHCCLQLRYVTDKAHFF